MLAPDFDAIARRYNTAWGTNAPLDLTPRAIAELAEQLRQVWNARGAADLDAMETAHTNYDWTALEDALRGLDR